jgi:hypothetical protein
MASDAMVTVIDIMADTAVLMGITGAIAVTEFKGLRPLFSYIVRKSANGICVTALAAKWNRQSVMNLEPLAETYLPEAISRRLLGRVSW